MYLRLRFARATASKLAVRGNRYSYKFTCTIYAQGDVAVPFTDKHLDGFLYAVEGVGAVFVSVFLTVYLIGLRDVPKNVVYHSEPAFRTVLSVVGIVFIVLVLSAVVAAFVLKRKD